MSSADDEVSKDLAPNGVLRAAISLGNPVLARGTPAAPGSGLAVAADVDREGTRIIVGQNPCYHVGNDPR